MLGSNSYGSTTFADGGAETTTTVDTLDLQAHLGKDWLVVAEPFDRATQVSLGLFPPLADAVLYPSTEWRVTGGQSTLYVAATTGRSTANDDTPAATYIPGGLEPFNWGFNLFGGVDPLQRSRAGTGVIVIGDPSGELNTLIGRVWDGAPITLLRGDRGSPIVGWQTVGRFRSAGLLYDTAAKQIRLRDLGWQLGGALHAEYYGGTGGTDGDANLAGRIKPWALGYCFNVEPVLINAASQIFQFTFTSAASVSACRHGGAALAFDADYADYAALAAASVGSGEYATCLALGLVRVNVTLTFGIRLDVVGDNDTDNGHTGPDTRAQIARRIATAHGANRLDDEDEIDATSIDEMDAEHPATVGWYFVEPISKADALDRVLAGILGWWRVRPDGRLSIGWVADPADYSAAVTVAYKAEGMSRPRVVDTAPPRNATYISWRTNYGPVSDRSQLAGSVSDADAAIYTRPARYGSSVEPAVATIYPTSVAVTITEAGFWEEADAVAEASRQQEIMGVERTRWEWEWEVDPLVDLIGSGVTITDTSALGLGDSATFVCVGINAPGAGAATFEFFR